MSEGNTAPPGWYADPGNQSQIRYWDGQRWTEHIAPGTPPAFQPAYGAQPGYHSMPPQQRGTNGMAIASLVVSLACCGPLGFIFGLVALNQIKKSGQDGKGLAIAGTIIGGIGIAGLILSIFLLAAAGSG